MTRQWYGYAETGCEQMVRDALAAISPSGQLHVTRHATELRRLLRDEEPNSASVIVGPCADGVSDINLAAALVADGRAEEVVLVARRVTGSLRSRAACAGITRVLDMEEAASSALVADVPDTVEEGHGTDAPRAEGREHVRASGAARVAPRAAVVSFASGRGGVGKTSLAAVTAAAAGRWGMRVSLCDLDLTNGNLYECFGMERGADLAGIVTEGTIDREGLLGCGMALSDNVTLWGPCARPEMAEVVSPHAGEIIGTLASTSDLVLVDTSTTCNDAVAQAMQTADRLVMVHGSHTARLSSLARVSALAVRLGVARTRIARIENGCLARDVGQPFLPRAEVGLETARAFRIVDGGSEVRELLREGGASALSQAEGDFTQTCLAFIAQLLAELGCLPDCEEAHRCAEGVRRPRGFSLFGRRREAV